VTQLDEEYARLHPGVSPGRYVELSVSDAGEGMSPDVVARIFEPFFISLSPKRLSWKASMPSSPGPAPACRSAYPLSRHRLT
jgi:hypothetical protein